MSELKQKILAKLKQPVLSALATITEDGQPWVRYVTPFADDNLTIWLSTFIRSRKVAQIRRNPEVHLTTGVTALETAEAYLQIQGRAEILTDDQTKKAVWFDYLQNIFSGPDDPNYCVCKITPYRIEYKGMGLKPPEVWQP
ncbi:MAG: pyridoxamine 5'-phosphate oxidase family protein [Thermodesulfobacteriota bacterium]